MITFVPLSGFLGAGKTTTMIAAARALEGSEGRRVSVVTNDQGTELVDTTLARSALPLLDQVGEVTGGCFCCRFDFSDEYGQRAGRAAAGRHGDRRGRRQLYGPAGNGRPAAARVVRRPVHGRAADDRGGSVAVQGLVAVRVVGPVVPL